MRNLTDAPCNQTLAAISPHQPGYAIPKVDGIMLTSWSGVGVSHAADLEGLDSLHLSTNIAFNGFHMDEGDWKCSAINGTALDVAPKPCALLMPPT